MFFWDLTPKHIGNTHHTEATPRKWNLMQPSLMFVFGEDSILQPFESVHRKLTVVMMPTLPSLLAPQAIITTACGATSDDKVVIMTTLDFRCVRYYSSLGMYAVLIILIIAASTMIFISNIYHSVITLTGASTYLTILYFYNLLSLILVFYYSGALQETW